MHKVQVLIAEYVLPIDGKMTVYSPGAVAVANRKVLAVGKPEDVYEYCRVEKLTPDTLDFGRKIIMPGFVNTHSHFPMILMRGLGDDLELISWLNNYIFPLESKLLSKEFVYISSLVGAGELLRHGYTTVLDMYYFSEAQLKACDKIGIRGKMSNAIVDFPTNEFKNPDDAIDSFFDLHRKWVTHPRLDLILGPHSTYTVSPRILKRCKEAADITGTLLHIHLAESDQELITVREQSGKHPVELLADLGLLDSNLLAAHCVKLDENHISLLVETDTAVAHNPCSNLKISSGLAPVVEMRKRGIRVGLGTDGPMTSNRLDPFHAMDVCAKVHKHREDNPAVMSSLEVVRMATIESARALQMEREIGSLEEGKCADLIAIDYLKGQFAPIHDVYAHIVYACHGEMVTDVMVDGEWVVCDERLVKVDEEELLNISGQWKPKIDKIVHTKQKVQNRIEGNSL